MIGKVKERMGDKSFTENFKASRDLKVLIGTEDD